MREIAIRIAHTEEKIGELEQAVAAEREKRRDIARWAEMLWLDGIPLQNRACEGLRFIGIAAESANPTGHIGDLRANHADIDFIMEVTGSTGPITVDKGRQLLQWISESDHPHQVKGVLIGNAFRNSPPEVRPPTPNHKIFVTELEQMAGKFHFALLDVRELFHLVVAKLAGKEVKAEDVVKAMSVDGVVKFRTP